MSKQIQQYIPIVKIDLASARQPSSILANCNQIELSVRYSIGGVNILSGITSPRGYYLHATPTEIVDRGGYRMFHTALGTGVKDCLLEVSRQSDKQLAIACTLAETRAPELLEWCRREYGIQYEMPNSFFADAEKKPVPKSLPARTPLRKVETKPIRGMRLLTAEVIRKLEKHPIGS